jgi:hypothetical protein
VELSSPSLEAGLAADQRYGLLERVLDKRRYRRLSHGDKGIVRRLLVRAAGLSRAGKRMCGCRRRSSG